MGLFGHKWISLGSNGPAQGYSVFLKTQMGQSVAQMGPIVARMSQFGA